MGRFSETVMDHFQEPRNRGLLDPADAVGIVGTPGRGPFFVLYLRWQDERITAARFQCHGCGATIACGSMLTELLIGATLESCRGLTREALMEQLDGLPPDKIHCAETAIEALQQAIEKLVPDNAQSCGSSPHEENKYQEGHSAAIGKDQSVTSCRNGAALVPACQPSSPSDEPHDGSDSPRAGRLPMTVSSPGKTSRAMKLPVCEFRETIEPDGWLFCRHALVRSPGGRVTSDICCLCGMREVPSPYRRQRSTGVPARPTWAGLTWNLAASAAAFVADGLRTVTAEQYQQRLTVCQDCDQRTGNRCRACGCRLSWKARGRAFHCPLDKWPPLVESDSQSRSSLDSPT